jgi:hypothetical protein
MPGLKDVAAAVARTIEPREGERRQRLCAQWQQELLQGFLRGELRMFNAGDRRPIHADVPGAMVGALTTGEVTLRELNRWLAVIGTDVVMTESNLSTVAKPKRHASTDGEVRATAHRMADAWARDYFDATDTIPPEERVAKAIRKGLNDAFGKSWSDKTIRRHCLANWQFSPLVTSAQIAQ